jgi:hypothetical protein
MNYPTRRIPVLRRTAATRLLQGNRANVECRDVHYMNESFNLGSLEHSCILLLQRNAKQELFLVRLCIGEHGHLGCTFFA